MLKQVFGSALRQPWVLVTRGFTDIPGRRSPTAVAYLTDHVGDGYLGGIVEFYRSKTEAFACWHYRYQNARRFSEHEVVAFFPNPKSRSAGPTEAQVRALKRKLPCNPIVHAAQSCEGTVNSY